MVKECSVKRKTTILKVDSACNIHVHVIKLFPYDEYVAYNSTIQIDPNKTVVTLIHCKDPPYVLFDETHYPNIQSIIVKLSQCLKDQLLQIAYNRNEQCLSLYINTKTLNSLTSREKIISYRQVIHYFFPSLYCDLQADIKGEEEEEEEEVDKDDDFATDVSYMYSCLSRHPLKQDIKINPIISTLPYPHQQQAVSWMCSQEGLHVDDEEEERIEASRKQLHPLFVQWPGDTSYYYSPYTHYFTQEFQETVVHRNGGVICDTMGLGKTYEMLSLIATHQASPLDYAKVSVKRESNDQVIEKINWNSFIDDYLEYPDSFGDKSEEIRLKMDIQDIIHPAFEESISQFREAKIFCLCCDQTVNIRRGFIIQCSICHRFQHYECVFGSYNGRVDWSHYTCPHCLKETQPDCYPSKTSLVCVPGHIAVQWIDEIKKHIQPSESDREYNKKGLFIGKRNGIKYCLYPGIRAIVKSIQNDRECSILPCFLFREFLSCFDIVIVPYNVFTAEYDSVMSIKRSLRVTPRFPTCFSTLFLIRYWRIVLDEVHLVESSATLMKQVSVLDRKYMWCVSGTPFNVKFYEMYCVMVLLNVYHYKLYNVWRDCIETPLYEHEESVTKRLSALIRDYYWCTSMNDLQVLSPNLIPPQTREVHTVKLEAIERAYYQEVQSKCTSKVLAYLAKFSSLQNEFPRHILHTVLMHLKSLRQACNHYQIGNSSMDSSSVSTGTAPVMSLIDISVILHDKVRLDCEMNLRSMIAERNALAGYHILNNMFDQAYTIYKESIQLIKEQETKKIKTDYVQLIHIYTNMIDIAPSLSAPLPPETLQEYHTKTIEYEDFYVAKAKEEMEQVRKSLLSVCFSEDKLDEVFSMVDEILTLMGIDINSIEIPPIPDDIHQLYRIFLSKYTSVSVTPPSYYSTRILERVKSIIKNSPGVLNLEIDSIEGMVKFIKVWKAAVIRLRKEILDTIFKYNERPTEEMIQENSNCYSCHKRNLKVRTYCSHCRYEYLLHYYSSFLYSYVPKKNENEFLRASIKQKANTFTDNIAISIIYAILRGGYSVLPDRRINNLNHMSSQIEYTKRYINELQKEDGFFHSLWRKQYDYISTYDELRQCKTRIMEFPDTYEKCVEKCQCQIGIFNSELKSRLSRLNFISTVMQSARNPKSLECNICLDTVDTSNSILPCGHIFCSVCIDQFLLTSKQSRCPVCKQPFCSKEIMRSEETQQRKDPKVVGLLQKIINSEISAKILVYSQWDDSLTLLAHVLDEVKINYRVMKARNHYDSTSEFRNDPSVSVLLMLLQQGNNGLDMSIATHIIIMEPILSATMEAQAVSRVQRIGQKSPTVVHYVIVENTIESRIYELFKKRHENTKKQGYGIRENETLTREELNSLLQSNVCSRNKNKNYVDCK